MPNGITIYGDQYARQLLQHTVIEHPNIWLDTGSTIKIPEDKWMTILLYPDWMTKTKNASRVYPLSPYDKDLVDAAFDRIQWTEEPMPFRYLVFVMYQTLPNRERKGRVVVDIRELNKLTILDNCPMPRQDDIIATVQRCQYIILVDATWFFHQWPVTKKDRHKLTVISHRGSEQYQVAVMGFRNFSAFV